MKFAYFLIPLAILISPFFLSAQNNERKLEQDQESRALLELVNKKYHASPSLKLDFSLLVDMPEEESNIKSKGVVYLKNSKYKIDTEEMMIICDNVKRYVYLKESNELQVNYFEPEADEIESPSKLFELYKENYYSRMSGERMDNNIRVTVITLIPADIKQSPYKMIQLFVDKANNRIVKGEIHAKDGVKYTYGIAYSDENLNISDTEFSFDPAKYPGIYIDDMTK